MRTTLECHTLGVSSLPLWLGDFLTKDTTGPHTLPGPANQVATSESKTARPRLNPQGGQQMFKRELYMTHIEMFSNGEFELHVVPVGETFEVAAPGLARALGHRDAGHLVANLPDDEKGYRLEGTPGGQQEIWCVTEAGFYRAIGQRQAARIKNPEVRAKVRRFQDWVYKEVLPSLRRTGSYTIPTQRVEVEEFHQPFTFTWDEVCALLRQRYGMPYTVNQLTRALKSGGVLKQTGGPKKEWLHFFWFTGSAWNIHPHMVAQLAKKVVDTDQALQGMRFLQAQLNLEGIGSPRQLESW